MEVEDWLKGVEKKLMIAPQRNLRRMHKTKEVKVWALVSSVA
jgi:hypothetical protein